MVSTRTTGAALGVALAALVVGCGPPGERTVAMDRALEDDVPVPEDAAEQVRALTTLRAAHDEDGDGFVSPAEAEGYYRRYFAQLDDNNDGRLSRAELKPEAPGTPDLELAYEELVGATEQEYVDESLQQYNLRADRSIGMMSTREFDELVGDPDPALTFPRPGTVP
jgi:hypothetical protein